MTGTCKAVCQISSSSNNNVLGYLTLTQGEGGSTQITGSLSGLTTGKHGCSVNAAGDLTQGAKSCGDIFNPFGEFGERKNLQECNESVTNRRRFRCT